ncbi:lysylphosphatidylglycerol synthase transmembrane domain-containing protein [Paenibacillus glycinis]|uniref:Phosphatidylglycerol lysyltransferase n=1 Tax=Paenibacillus glycinis TaxID=2697035 RepID=A0ABW9XR67_9BACL|nr:lysylphosphatidylglycerol synthase transmembrane domain-containing protein [Paenibacillus glycinis]NBD25138.1 flippase-like domain-containing protein [Paenibacillus glycinis]
MRNKLFNFVVVVATFVIFLSFFLFTKGLKALIAELETLHLAWILAAAALVLLFWFFEMLVLYTIARKLHAIKNLLAKAVKFEMIGLFFGAVSPFSAGSNPAQLYAMTENGIPAGIAGSILMIKFILHQSINIAILVAAVLFRFGYFNARVDYFPYLCLLGLAIHVLIMAFAILFAINGKLTKRLLTSILHALHRVRLVKNTDAALGKIEIELAHFHENASFITKHVKMCAYASLFTLLQYAAFFSIPYCIYRSFGYHAADLWTLMCAQIFLVNFMAIIPLPGAAGGAEGGFYLIYGMFFDAGTIITAIFVWRVLTYYATIAAGSIFTLILPNARKHH